MSERFLERPILNSPYERPARHWELDESGQPTRAIVESRRRAEFITPIPKPKRRKKSAKQDEMDLDEGKGLSTQDRNDAAASTIDQARRYSEAKWKMERGKSIAASARKDNAR